MRIPKDFKSSVFVSADSKRVMGAFFVSADCEGVTSERGRLVGFGARIRCDSRLMLVYLLVTFTFSGAGD